MKLQTKLLRPDALLGTLAAFLACASASFPIYVHLNEKKFGPPRMQYAAIGSGELEGEAEMRKPRFQEPALSLSGAVVEASAIASAGESRLGQESDSPLLDGVVTGAISLPRARRAGALEPLPPQPFPEELAPYELVYASSGRALILDDGQIDMVRPNSMLSDGSVILSIQNSGPQWRIVTTGNRVLTWSASGS
jgi:hypothetical protein